MLNNGATVIPHSGVPSLPSGLTHVNAVICLTCDWQICSRGAVILAPKKKSTGPMPSLDMHHLCDSPLTVVRPVPVILMLKPVLASCCPSQIVPSFSRSARQAIRQPSGRQ